MLSSIAPAIKAVELVKQQRFNALNSLVIDNADTARVKYPEGFNSCFLSLEDFEDGISPGQACVFYNKDKFGYKVLGGGWIKN